MKVRRMIELIKKYDRKLAKAHAEPIRIPKKKPYRDVLHIEACNHVRWICALVLDDEHNQQKHQDIVKKHFPSIQQHMWTLDFYTQDELDKQNKKAANK